MSDAAQTSPRARRLGSVASVVLPAWSVRGLAGALMLGALGMPWLAQWQGVLADAGPHIVEKDATGTVVELRPELVWLPAGRFTMGSSVGDEQPAHDAEVASFAICRTEVTQGQWKAVMGAVAFDCDHGCGDEHPAQNVSWNDAVEFMNRLTELENALRRDRERLTTCYTKDGDSWAWTNHACTGYRLPTETEWEYAARADTTTEYGFGDDVAQLREHAWYDGDSDATTHPVGEKLHNDWALYDMHGNVYEWVWDWRGDYPSIRMPAGHAGPKVGEQRVLRGGSAYSTAELLRSASRIFREPGFADRGYGFRCARNM